MALFLWGVWQTMGGLSMLVRSTSLIKDGNENFKTWSTNFTMCTPWLLLSSFWFGCKSLGSWTCTCNAQCAITRSWMLWIVARAFSWQHIWTLNCCESLNIVNNSLYPRYEKSLSTFIKILQAQSGNLLECIIIAKLWNMFFSLSFSFSSSFNFMSVSKDLWN